MNLTFPSGDNWALFVVNTTRAVVLDQYYATFYWFQMDDDFPAGVSQTTFQSSASLLYSLAFYNTILVGDDVVSSVNYYMQSGGMKFSGTSDPFTFASPTGDIFAPGQCLNITRRSKVRNPGYMGRTRIPLIGTGYVDPQGYWTAGARLQMNLWQNAMLNGLPGPGGVTFNYSVYCKGEDSLWKVDYFHFTPRPSYLRRRRWREWKVGHHYTPPSNWYVPGHW